MGSLGDLIAAFQIVKGTFDSQEVVASNNDAVLRLKKQVLVFQNILDRFESNPALVNPSVSSTLADLTDALKATENFMNKYCKIKKSTIGKAIYSASKFIFSGDNAKAIANLIERLHQCAQALGLQQIMDNEERRVETDEMILNALAGQSLLTEEERDELRTDVESYFQTFTAQLVEIENKSLIELRAIYSDLEFRLDRRHQELIHEMGLMKLDLKQVIGGIERVMEGGIEVNEKIDEVIEGGKGVVLQMGHIGSQVDDVFHGVHGVAKQVDDIYAILKKEQETGKLSMDEAAYREKEISNLRIKNHSDFTVHKEREPLGEGGFGKVYLGTYGGTKVAVKCIVCKQANGNWKHVENEILLLDFSKHPQVVRIYGKDLNLPELNFYSLRNI